MSRKTQAAKAAVVAGAVAATTLFLGGTASAVPAAITKVGPALAGTDVALPMLVNGTGFSSSVKSVLWQSVSGGAGCASSAVVVVSPTVLYAVKPVEGCAAGLQKVSLHDDATPSGSTRIGAVFAGVASKTVTFVTPAGVSSAEATPSTGVAGTPVTFTGLSGLTSRGLSATLGGKAVGSVKYVSATSFTGLAPAGINNGPAALQVTSGGVTSSVKDAAFTFKPSIAVSPAFAPKDAPGQLLVTGLGLKPAAPATVVVTVCGVVAPQVAVSTSRPWTDTKLWVTAPSAAAIQTAQTALLAEGASAFGTDGGACAVKVTTDVNGATADQAYAAAVEDDPDTTEVDETAAEIPAQVNPSSVVTRNSTFTYAAF